MFPSAESGKERGGVFCSDEGGGDEEVDGWGARVLRSWWWRKWRRYKGRRGFADSSVDGGW